MDYEAGYTISVYVKLLVVMYQMVQHNVLSCLSGCESLKVEWTM